MTMHPAAAGECRFKRASLLAVLCRLYAGSRRRLCAGLFFIIVKHLPYLYAPVATANIINALIYPTQHRFAELWINAAIMLALILENVPMHTLANFFLSRAIRSMEARVRGDLVRQVQQLSIGFHDAFQSGRLQSKLLTDVEALVTLSNALCNTVFMGLLNLLFAMSMTLAKKPVMALFFLFAVPMTVMLMRLFHEDMRRRTKEYRMRVESMSARLSEMVDMIPITRAHGLEDAEIGAMTSRLEDVRKAGFRLDVLNAWFGASTWVTMQVFQLLCLVVTGLMAMRSMIPVGDVVMYQGFFAMMIGSVSMFLNMYPQLSRGAEAAASIGEVLDCPDIEHNFGKKPVAAVCGEFTFEDVEFAYPAATSPAVRGITLRVAAGECVALVGESGAGKSTILNLIIGFRRPTKGRILLDGIDMEELDLRQFRRSLAVVTQRTILFSGTIRDNIAYGLQQADERRIREAIEMANAAEFIDRFPQGLDTVIGEAGKTLSGGQQQRISIARALIRDPRVIILDEATSSLDVISELQVQQAIERLIAGRTTFVAAHRLSTIRIAHRIVVMKAGAIIEEGTHDALMARQGEFFRLRSLQ